MEGVGQKVNTKKLEYIFNSNITKLTVVNVSKIHSIHNLIFSAYNNHDNFFKVIDDILNFLYHSEIRTPAFVALIEKVIYRALALCVDPTVLETKSVSSGSVRYGLKLPFLLISKETGSSIPTNLDTVYSFANSENLLDFSTALASYRKSTNLFRKYLLCRFLWGKLRHLEEETRLNPEFKISNFNVASAYLASAKKFLRSEFSSTKDARIQIHELIGRPGIGKSRTLLALQFVLSAIVPEIPSDQQVYARSHDKWWNDYCGQPIILYDDVAHDRSPRVDYINELISVGSGTFSNVPMAFIKDMPFTSSLVIITGNFPIITTASSESASSALRRRMHSDHYEPLQGLGRFDEQSIFRFDLKGLCLNTIRSRETKRFGFSLFSETFDILKADDDVECEDPFLYEMVSSDSHAESPDSVVEDLYLGPVSSEQGDGYIIVLNTRAHDSTLTSSVDGSCSKCSPAEVPGLHARVVSEKLDPAALQGPFLPVSTFRKGRFAQSIPMGWVDTVDDVSATSSSAGSPI